jgi:hypothetical protein
MTITTAEVFAYLSASLWFVSALIRLPSNVWFQAHLGGGARNEKFETLVRRLQTMSLAKCWCCILCRGIHPLSDQRNLIAP